MSIRTICIYHGNCADGFTAAWAVRQALGYETEFIPASYGDDPPDVRGADVVLVDFSYKRPVLMQLAAQARSVLVLDHHKTAEADLAGIPELRADFRAHSHEAAYWSHREGPYLRASFDMDRSGAQMAWDYFHGGSRPLLVDYVGDRDLWRFDLPRSREISAWVFAHVYDFHVWNALSAQLYEGSLKRVAEMGAAILMKHDKDVAELLEVATAEMVIGGHRVPVANLPYTMASDAAGKLAECAPFAACYFDRADCRVFSLRSRGKGGLDVSQIAAAYGGGGHRNAAGFQAAHDWRGDDV